MKQVGTLSVKVINILQLNIAPNTPIFIGSSNIEHIKNRHPYEYDKYFNQLQEILAEPDYVGMNPNNNSIQFVKLYKVDSEYIRIAVKLTPGKVCFVKSLHMLSTYNAKRYIEKGTLKELDNNHNSV